jgi:hypothetical protein
MSSLSPPPSAPAARAASAHAPRAAPAPHANATTAADAPRTTPADTPARHPAPPGSPRTAPSPPAASATARSSSSAAGAGGTNSSLLLLIHRVALHVPVIERRAEQLAAVLLQPLRVPLAQLRVAVRRQRERLLVAAAADLDALLLLAVEERDLRQRVHRHADPKCTPRASAHPTQVLRQPLDGLPDVRARHAADRQVAHQQLARSTRAGTPAPTPPRPPRSAARSRAAHRCTPR